MNLAPATFEDLIARLRAVTGVIAATALRYGDAGAERIYSTHPDRFRATGFKTFAEAPMIGRVRAAGQPVLTIGADALRGSFADGQDILDCGCDAILNIPVHDAAGRLVGQVNLMGHGRDFPESLHAELYRIAMGAVACLTDATGKETS